jgi:hypothetical protein
MFRMSSTLSISFTSVLFVRRTSSPMHRALSGDRAPIGQTFNASRDDLALSSLCRRLPVFLARWNSKWHSRSIALQVLSHHDRECYAGPCVRDASGPRKG